MTESVSLNADGRLREREIDSWTESEIGGIVGLFGDAGARAERPVMTEFRSMPLISGF